MSAPFAYDVFLSHNTKDKPRVRKLAERLRAEGLRVWFDDWVIRAGDAIYLTIEHGLEASRTLLLCMSPAAFGSDWVGLERETVLFRDPTNRECRFIPVLLADCNIPATLRRYKYVDYRDEGDAALRELMEVCRVETEKAALVEASPDHEVGKPESKIVQSFLCHASEDKTAVLDIYDRLKASGYKPWLDKKDLIPGQRWRLEIPKAIRASDFILIFLSKTSVVKRGYVQQEFKLAWEVLQEQPEGTIHTVPVRLDECSIPEQFGDLHWCNLFEPDGFENRLRALQAGRSSPVASEPAARKVLAMDQMAAQALDTQALEQILIGHMMAICGEANQIFRPVSMFDDGIDGEVEFKDNDGKPSGQKIYVRLKSGDAHLRQRQRDQKYIFDVKNPRHLTYWTAQPCDVYLVIRDSAETIRWMNVTAYLKTRRNKQSKQITFDGEKLDAPATWRLRDRYIKRAYADAVK